MDKKRNIVLASQSPRRRELLARLVPEFNIIVDNSEEVVEDGVPPEETVRRLALQKATNVADKAAEDALVIAADTMVFINGRVLGKPADENEAWGDASSSVGQRALCLYRICGYRQQNGQDIL